MDEPTIQFSTVSDPMKWDSEGAGVICFASPEDAKRAEVIFNSVQGAAYKAGREAGMRRAAEICKEKAAWTLGRQDGLAHELSNVIVRHHAAAHIAAQEAILAEADK